ncbi:MAG: dihydroorotate dehydrogenase electron transfer subunit [Oscillospiraceae bacterium]|nr:dihydroorotate dehydrogenase electron transfer subunit [Oscillospiraceae bacterium]
MKKAQFRLQENRPLTARVNLLLLSPAEALEEPFRPGQFVNVALPGFFLRRPFSVCDQENGSITLLVERVGSGTELLHTLPVGTELELLTGLGNGFERSVAGNAPLLIGGGTGLSPLFGLAKRLLAEGVTPSVILGFNTKDDVFFEDAFQTIGLSPTITTADGSYGIPGFVTDAMEGPHSFFYACGPEAMLRAVCAKSTASGELAFDVRMGCGFGACMGCTKQTARGPKRVCKDGPVFRKEELEWAD